MLFPRKISISFLIVFSSFAFTNAQQHLYNVKDVRNLSPTEAAKHFDVTIEGVITYDSQENNYGFIQDNTAGIFLFFREGDTPVTGDLVRIKGKAYPGDFAPIIDETQVKVLGKGEMPAAQKNIEDKIFNGHEDSQWIGVEGIIKSVNFNEYHQSVQMMLDMQGRSIQLYLKQFNENLPFHLLGSKVFAEGVGASNFNQNKQLLGIRMMVPSMKNIKVLSGEPQDPFTKEPLKISELMQFSSDFNIDHRIKIRGTIIHPGIKQKIYIQDSTGSIVVKTNKKYSFNVGDVIDVVGFTTSGELGPEIEEGLCEKTGEDKVEIVYVDSLTPLIEIPEASLINLQATLLKVLNQETYTELYLEKENMFFQAHLEVNDSTLAEMYEAGSVVSLTGITQLSVNPLEVRLTGNGIKIPDGIQIILRGKEDIALISPPPWLSMQKVLGILVGLVVLIALITFWVYILKKQVAQRTRELVDAQKEKDAILTNVEEGFFLLDKELKIQSQFSTALLEIMESDSPAGKTLVDYISPRLKKDNVELIKSFIDLLNDNSIDEDALKDLNPISKLEFKFNKDNDLSDSKYLTYEFKRIYKKEKLLGIIVTVIDETEEFLLSQKLKETEEKSKRQVEWLMSVIQLDSGMLTEFMKSTHEEFDQIETLLKTEKQEEYKDNIDQISRSLHLLKGNANLLDIKIFAEQVHQLEDVVISIKSKPTISGSDLVPVVFGIESLKENVKDLQNLIDKLSSLNYQQLKKDGKKEPALIKSIKAMVNSISKEQDKKVDINTDAFDINMVPSQYIILLKNVLVQLTRNSLAHGIESLQERKQTEKPEIGTIKLQSSVCENRFVLKYSDDGRGLQLDKLKLKAVELNKTNQNEVDKLDKNTLANLIFTNGITSKKTSDHISGRGVGMDLVKSQLDKHKGIITVDFEENKFCEFTISLPLSA